MPLINKYFFRRVCLKLWSLIPSAHPVASSEKIDIVIPIIEKDLRILPLCLQGIRDCVANPIKDIYIVAPPIKAITEFCIRENLIFLEESCVLGFSPNDIDLKISTGEGTVFDRSGWLFQQLVKLSGNIGSCENYLCIDSDHILIRKHTFLQPSGIPVLYASSECHEAYYRNIHKLLPQVKLKYAYSFVAHKMLFNKTQLQRLHSSIEAHNGKPWIKSVIEGYDRSQGAGFSEFELYGSFLDSKTLRPWKQLALPYSEITDYDCLKKAYGSHFNSITFSSYTCKQ